MEEKLQPVSYTHLDVYKRQPFDSIQPYRLEMQCKLKVQDYNDLYAYWQDTLAKVLLKEVHTHKEKYLLNLSSKEYEKAIRPYIPKEQWIDVIFQVEKKGKRKVCLLYTSLVTLLALQQRWLLKDPVLIRQ